jgi:hypothetical protein
LTVIAASQSFLGLFKRSCRLLLLREVVLILVWGGLLPATFFGKVVGVRFVLQHVDGVTDLICSTRDRPRSGLAIDMPDDVDVDRPLEDFDRPIGPWNFSGYARFF